MQQSLGRFLGVLDYDAYPHGLLEARQCLLESVKLSVRLEYSRLTAVHPVFSRPKGYRMSRLGAIVTLLCLRYLPLPSLDCQSVSSLTGIIGYTATETLLQTYHPD
jgi:hypothetical protein